MKKVLIFSYLFLVSCTNNNTTINEYYPAEMLGNTYYNCKVNSIIRKQDEVILNCTYNNEKVIVSTYVDNQTKEQIEDELIDILFSNDVYWYTVTD